MLNDWHIIWCFRLSLNLSHNWEFPYLHVYINCPMCMVSSHYFWCDFALQLQAWSQFANELTDFKLEEKRGDAVHCLNLLITNALYHVPDVLKYMSRIKNQSVFNFCAIPQVRRTCNDIIRQQNDCRKIFVTAKSTTKIGTDPTKIFCHTVYILYTVMYIHNAVVFWVSTQILVLVT